MKHSFLLGLDIGTSGAKAILINVDGAVIASATTEYSMFTPHPLWSEQHPEDWWNATVKSIQKVLSAGKINSTTIAAIGLTGQMHGLVLLDNHGNVLRPCIMWNDQRTAKQCDEITNRIGSKKLLEITGNPVLPGFTAPKILWVHENESDIFARISKILLPKDYIRYRLTNEFFTDVSDASGTSLLNVGKRTWSEELISSLKIKNDWLPEVCESQIICSHISKQASTETKLLEGIPVVAGAGDQAAQAIGSGIISEGIVSVTIGTSGVVFASSDKFRIEPEGKLHAFCHAIPNTWHLMGVMLSAGGSFRWFRDTFCETEIAQARKLKIDPYELMTDEASKISAGSDGLIFLPYLSGERTPHADPYSRGAFIGLTIRHTKAHLTRAVMEGVSFGLMDSLELMKSCGVNIQQVRVSGGGARSKVWRQMLADIFQTDIVCVNVIEGAAYGAAMLSGVGVGIFPNVNEAVNRCIKTLDEIVSSKDVEIYKEQYLRFRELYPVVKGINGNPTQT